MAERHRIRSIEQHRNFDDDAVEPVKEGPTFKLGGEDFHCLPALAGGVLPRLVRAVGVDARGKAVNNPDILRFMEECLCDQRLVMQPNPDAPPDDVDSEVAPQLEVWEDCDDVDRWRALMEDKRRPIEAEKLGEIVSWLIEWYTDRPTRPSGR